VIDIDEVRWKNMRDRGGSEGKWRGGDGLWFPGDPPQAFIYRSEVRNDDKSPKTSQMW
jgi:hypothetical protein